MDAFDSALRNGPAAEYDPHLLGLSAFVIWSLHPLTWFLASWFVEGLVRIFAAISLEQHLAHVASGFGRLVLRQGYA
jgi:ACR3 family arsenite efflux pump ArsB